MLNQFKSYFFLLESCGSLFSKLTFVRDNLLHFLFIHLSVQQPHSWQALYSLERRSFGVAKIPRILPLLSAACLLIDSPLTFRTILWQ